jgi:hypothetical protein
MTGISHVPRKRRWAFIAKLRVQDSLYPIRGALFSCCAAVQILTGGDLVRFAPIPTRVGSK